MKEFDEIVEEMNNLGERHNLNHMGMHLVLMIKLCREIKDLRESIEKIEEVKIKRGTMLGL